jgi:tripartite-type tricarboxylate transporter receptor subunit TctC
MAACAGVARCLFLFLLLVTSAGGQEYPSKPIRLIATTPPGGLVDVLARMYAQALGERLGQAVIVENRTGATTLIGIEAVARAPADGYTLLLGTSEMTMLPSLKKNYPYDPVRDFAPVALIASSWTVFAVNPKVPAQTLPELIAYAKTHPGAIHYGTNGVGGVLHIAVELLRMKTGVDMVHVPYKGGGQAITDVVSGQIEMGSLGLASVLSRRGQVRVLAQTGSVRHPLLADVPTTAELGLPSVKMETWFGLLAPTHSPATAIARLARETRPILEQNAFKQKLFGIGCDSAWMPPEVFAVFLAEEEKKWATILPAIGIAPED